MRKYARTIGSCLLIAAVVWTAMIIADKQALRDELIRLHIVAASDSEEDQALKLRVRDAVLCSLREDLRSVADVEQARAYLQENLPKVEAVANRVLQEAGSSDLAKATLQLEEFDIRYYDTFTLPAGIYEALRITIGDGEGHNWWCVAFPALCVGVTVQEFEESASCAGLPATLTGAIAGEEPYEVRFLVLDVLGRLENFLHKG